MNNKTEDTLQDCLPDFTQDSQLGKFCTGLRYSGSVGVASWHRRLLVCEGNGAGSTSNDQTTDKKCKHVLPTANGIERVGHRK